MKRAKTVDEIYEEVRDHSLVITNDAALATALNARVDRPVVGFFAVTPRMLAKLLATETLGVPLKNDLELMSIICKDVDSSFRFVHAEVENIREISRYTSDVRKHLHSRFSRLVYDSYSRIPTLEMVMERFDPDKSRFYSEQESIAIVGVELFDNLDKKFTPYGDFTEVDLFTSEPFEFDTAYEIGNDRQLAENAVALIDASRPSDYAIVVNISSPLTDAVRASLYRRRLPFINSLNVRDLAQIRDYINFLRLGLNYDTIRVRHVKEIFSNYNGFFRKGREKYLLSKQTEDDMRERASELQDIMRNIRNLTFGEVRDRLCDRRARIQVGIVIDSLAITDEKVTSHLMEELTYAVDNVSDLRHNEEIPIEEKVGVLVADCRNSAFIDRPVVIYLGMEQDWNHKVLGKRYLDVEDEMDRNVTRTSVLLQQGSRRFYLVNRTKNGEMAKPSMSFELMLNSGRPYNDDHSPVSVKGFRDVFREVVTGRWVHESEAIIPNRGEDTIDDEKEFKDKFTKSTYNMYVSCPLSYLFRQCLPGSDEKSTEFGNLIHEFSELYLCHPEVVRDMGVETFVDMISDRYSGLSSPSMEVLDHKRIGRVMNNVMMYIDRVKKGPVPLDIRNDSRSHPNRFMLSLGIEFCSSVCEVGYNSTSHPLYGQIDLILDGVITDYKTGGAKDGGTIVKAMDLDSGARYFEFQPMLYLQLAMEHDKRSECEFRMFHVMDRDVESAKPGFDIMGNVRTVKVLDKSTREILAESPLYGIELKLSKDYQPFQKDILIAIAENAIGDPDDWREDSALVNTILGIVGKKASDTNIKNAKAAIGKVSKLVHNGIVHDKYNVLIPRNVLDSFMETLDEQHAEMRASSLSGFEARPRINCADCSYRSACTLSVIGEEEVDSDE